MHYCWRQLRRERGGGGGGDSCRGPVARVGMVGPVTRSCIEDGGVR